MGEMNLSPAAFYHMTARVAAKIQQRMCVVLEGGYDVASVARCSQAVMAALLGDGVPSLDDARGVQSGAVKALKKVMRAHRKFWDGCFDSPAHKACLAGNMTTEDLELGKNKKLLRAHAKVRSQMLKYGNNPPHPHQLIREKEKKAQARAAAGGGAGTPRPGSRGWL